MLNVTNLPGNTNQNHGEVASDTYENGYCQKNNQPTNQTSLGKDAEKRESWTLRWEWKLLQPLWNAVCRFLQIFTLQLPYDPAFQFWAFI